MNFGDANIDHEKGTVSSEFVELNYAVFDGQAPLCEDLSISHDGENETFSKINTNANSSLQTQEIISKSTPNEHLVPNNSSRRITDYIAPETIGFTPNISDSMARRSAYYDISDVLTSKEHHQPLPALEPTYFQNSPPWVDSFENDLVKTEYKNTILSLTQRQMTLGARFSSHELHLKYLENNRNHFSFIISPTELGRIRLDISRDKHFSIRVRADRAVTKKLLQEHLDLFLNELNLDGILDTDVYFDSNDEGGEPFFNNYSESYVIESALTKDSQSHCAHHVLISRALVPLTSLSLRL